jgi:hypothetical protein
MFVMQQQKGSKTDVRMRIRQQGKRRGNRIILSRIVLQRVYGYQLFKL